MLPLWSHLKLLKNVPKLHLQVSTNLLHTTQVCEKKKKGKSKKKCQKGVAVVLCGCGAMDGTEISEAVSAAIHITSKGLVPNFYAPAMNICATVNHLTQDVEDCPIRNAMIESARISRGKIKHLCECSPCENVALMIPGGFGAARTLSDFASKGSDCIVHPDLIKAIKDFNCACKPIGCMCIASVLVAKVLEGVKVTLGKSSPPDQWPYAEAIQKLEQMGACHEERDVKGVTHCKEYNVFSTPAWMDCKASFSDVHEGIGKMVNALKKHIK